ncbi:MAG TPA: TIGR04255 family protein [Fimbriiglobus sp.]|jgi:uncharacterized protein (TIGR04255 family)
MAKSEFKLDLNEAFPRLARPPIVEAVIHWQARAQKSFEPEELRSALAQKLPEYPSCEPLQHVEFKAMVSSEDVAPVVHHKKGWQGFRLKSEDGRYVVQFKRDGIVFSRTQGYEHWEPFTTAAVHVWNAFLELAAPVEIQRLGVRFINHFADAKPETLAKILDEPPTCPANLPLKEFVYQSTFTVPGHPFGIRVIKVMQPSIPEQSQSSGLFLDNDVFTTTVIRNARDEAEVNDALTKMRWLKNKLFFYLVTKQTVESFR